MTKQALPAGRQGFTLVELVISFVLFGLVLSSGFLFLGTRLNIYHKEKALLKQHQTEQRVINLISKELRNCLKVVMISSSEVKIKLKDKEITYGLKDKKIRRKTGKRNAYLTMPGEIETLSFKILAPKLLSLAVGKLKQTVYLRN